MTDDFIQAASETSPLQWATTASEYFKAVHELALKGITHNLQITMRRPAYVLLGYAFEQVLKCDEKLRCGEVTRTHDLAQLWDAASDDLKACIPDLTEEFACGGLSEPELKLLREEDPDYGYPDGDFRHNLVRLNKWTNAPYLARYPVEGLMKDGLVDIRYMHFIGDRLWRFLYAKIKNG